MSFVCLIFASIFNLFFMEHGFQNGPKSIWESILLAIFFEGRFFEAFWSYFVSFWLPLGSPWLTFGSLLAPLGCLLVPFGFLLAHFWCPLAHFWCLGLTFGDPGARFSRFWCPLASFSIFRFTTWMGS